MINKFTEISPSDARAENVFNMIGKQWMLITAKNNETVNTMTASWGTLGVLWGKPVAICYIRPQRYTFPIVESGNSLSLSFLGEEYRNALKLCGTLSGRDVDKFKASGLTVSQFNETPFISEAETVLICKKLYADYLRENAFISEEPLSHYPTKDFHKFYICEIEKILVKE